MYSNWLASIATSHVPTSARSGWREMKGSPWMVGRWPGQRIKTFTWEASMDLWCSSPREASSSTSTLSPWYPPLTLPHPGDSTNCVCACLRASCSECPSQPTTTNASQQIRSTVQASQTLVLRSEWLEPIPLLTAQIQLHYYKGLSPARSITVLVSIGIPFHFDKISNRLYFCQWLNVRINKVVHTCSVGVW